MSTSGRWLRHVFRQVVAGCFSSMSCETAKLRSACFPDVAKARVSHSCVVLAGIVSEFLRGGAPEIGSFVQNLACAQMGAPMLAKLDRI